MKRTDGQAAPEDESEDEGRSTAFWIAIAVVLAIPMLIVATVIGSAVIGAFVLGVGDSGAQTPMVEWQTSYDDASNTVTFTHGSGDVLDTQQLEVTVAGANPDWSVDGDEMTAGDEITVQDVERGETVRIIWTSDQGSATIGQYRVPR